MLGHGFPNWHPRLPETYPPPFIHLAYFMRFQRVNKSSPLENNCGVKCGSTANVIIKTYYKTISYVNILAVCAVSRELVSLVPETVLST